MPASAKHDGVADTHEVDGRIWTEVMRRDVDTDRVDEVADEGLQQFFLPLLVRRVALGGAKEDVEVADGRD